MKTRITVPLIMAALISTSSFAADTNFEQRKTDQLKRIDERIAHLNEERACIQGAANHDALKACREKFKAEIKADRANRRK